MTSHYLGVLLIHISIRNEEMYLCGFCYLWVTLNKRQWGRAGTGGTVKLKWIWDLELLTIINPVSNSPSEE